MGRRLLPDEVRWRQLNRICRHLIHGYRRPRSMVGGDLHWIWKPYSLYQEIDYVRHISSIWVRGIGTNDDRNVWTRRRQVYGVKALQENDGFPNAQCKLPFVVLVARPRDANLFSESSLHESHRNRP